MVLIESISIIFREDILGAFEVNLKALILTAHNKSVKQIEKKTEKFIIGLATTTEEIL